MKTLQIFLKEIRIVIWFELLARWNSKNNHIEEKKKKETSYKTEKVKKAFKE